MIDQFHRFCQCAARTAHRMVGIPDYEKYLDRHRTLHPALVPLTYEAFIREVQKRRYTPEKGKFTCGCC
ncbi:MAG TPA: YbdD/YjiX family protein [Acetobacteraceae bacterium]|nr:YbdD/YjiX family protein [Acetobacteraceae bacterium]